MLDWSESRLMDEPQAPFSRPTRRFILKTLLAGTAVAWSRWALAQAVCSHVAPARAQLSTAREVGDWKPLCLSPEQRETLDSLAEQILPGSRGAGVSRFVDLLLSVDASESRQGFANSLAAVNGECNRRFHENFPVLSAEQQVEILEEFLNIELSSDRRPEHSADLQGSGPGERQKTQTKLREDFGDIKNWIVDVYYASEIGMRSLGWTGEVVFEGLPVCAHPEGHH